MKTKQLILISVILILCLMTSCSNINSTGEDKEAEKSQGGISLPCEDEFIVDVKVDKGKLMLSTMSVAEDFSTSTATIWESADEGVHWKKAFEEVSSKYVSGLRRMQRQNTAKYIIQMTWKMDPWKKSNRIAT